MTPNIPTFQSAHILIIGDVMLDRYWHGVTSRISPEAPVPVVRIKNKKNCLGVPVMLPLTLEHSAHKLA